MLYLFVSTHFLTENRFAPFLESSDEAGSAHPPLKGRDLGS
ncbi:UNVERIFIED_ORG: hypothetical protein J2W85_000208 [Ensifer adhaerens]|jgi:hypothetical protein|nr:hypothetical protein [Ensifer adhaerens]